MVRWLVYWTPSLQLTRLMLQREVCSFLLCLSQQNILTQYKARQVFLHSLIKQGNFNLACRRRPQNVHVLVHHYPDRNAMNAIIQINNSSTRSMMERPLVGIHVYVSVLIRGGCVACAWPLVTIWRHLMQVVQDRCTSQIGILGISIPR